MPQIKNSEIVEQVLKTLVSISSRKTTAGYAVTTMDSLLSELRGEYDFLKHVEIEDTRFLEDASSISVVTELDAVAPSEIGKALSALIRNMDRSLGKDAGHFFIKEIQNRLSSEYYAAIRDEMGVDLSLMQLEHEVLRWEESVE